MFGNNQLGALLVRDFKYKAKSPLFEWLKGDSDLLSPRQLTFQVQQALQCPTDVIINQQAAHWAPELLFFLIILHPAKQPHALMFQWDPNAPDSLFITEWIYLPHQITKTISTQHEMMAQLVVKA